MKTTTLQEVIAFVSHCTRDDRDRVIEVIRDTQRQAQVQAAYRFNVGDKVYFTAKRGNRVYGTIVLVNRTKINLTDTNGSKWRVSPTLLTLQTSKVDEEKFYNSPWSR